VRTSKGTTFKNLDDVAVIDVETTGLNPSTGKIVSIAIVKSSLWTLCRQGKMESKFYETKINPGKKIPSSATAIHGITNDMVVDAGYFGDYAEEMLDFIDGRPLVAHNCDFDAEFIYQELKRIQKAKEFKMPLYCTMKRACYHLQKIEIYRNTISLVDACSHFGIDFNRTHFHDPLEDAVAALQLSGTFHALDA
jgi:DNA polymerase-3 subunit epsilon